MSKSILIKMKQGMNSFRPSEQKIAKYIIDNPKEAGELSVMEMAKMSDTSVASVIRLCKTLGLKGYQDLKIAISIGAMEDRKKDKVLHEEINADDSPKIILDKMAAGSIQAIEETREVLSIPNLEAAIDAIDKANSIHVFSVGASSIVGLDAQYKFSRINMPTFMYFDHHIQITSAVHLTKKDVAIGISHSGRTKEVIDVLKIAKDRNATTIAITQYGKSPIQEVSDIVLYTASVENNFRSGAMASRMAQLLVIDSLFIGVACRRYDDVIGYLELTREALEDKKY
ncbi:MurR/RpiR family transcriptional regulator [Clostridium sp. Cult3]|uniref:MurR/RpiR family transcriptional regulator n=1 Tax=Clostridium sp. Cult3 TaxID=2079004 RepID=UPI001F3E7D2F|nr:MurR/RpiR family transcriptional regulator [Clostridium sp. Cult3]MCF6459850.1 RpiR family transcriptional regulator [Clostridium sp. Cult3]